MTQTIAKRRCKLQMAPYILTAFHEVWSMFEKWLKHDQHIYPPAVNSALCWFVSAKWDANNWYKNQRR